jgi:ribosomal protein S27AE
MAWVTDLTHFLDETGALPDGLPRPARRLAVYLASIVEAATAVQRPGGQTVAIQCRRRPGHRRCPGVISYRILSDTRVNWACPRCGDNGFIANWQGTAWDRSPHSQVH